jgi:hypothetical protein
MTATPPGRPATASAARASAASSLAVAVLAGSQFLAVMSTTVGAGGRHGSFGPVKSQYGGNWPY